MKKHITIKFHGMTSTEQSAEVRNYLESLLRHAPSESTCHLHLFKDNYGYLCKLTVHSAVKTFSAHSKEETLTKTVKTVLRNVKDQIAQWKNDRSSSELTGVTSITRLNLKTLDQLEAEEEKEEVEKKVA